MTITSLLLFLILGLSVVENNTQLICLGKSEETLFITKIEEKKILKFKLLGKKMSINITNYYDTLKKTVISLNKILDLNAFHKNKTSVLEKIRNLAFLLALKI